MKTIIVAAYAVNPYKGSEDGTGWNLVRQIAIRNHVHLITRLNNRPDLERYLKDNPEDWQNNITFHYFDLPYWARFWKRGKRGALPYYMLWQTFLPRFIRREKLDFDLAHHLNFHNDWLPQHLWKLGKPSVWGPVGHHPPIPKGFLASYGFSAWWRDRQRHWIKQAARLLNPWYRYSIKRTDGILTISDIGSERLRFPQGKTHRLPAVGAHPVTVEPSQRYGFRVLSVGRFVPLKGFDITIRSFAKFADRIPPKDRHHIRLSLIGRGPQKELLQKMAIDSGHADLIDFIEWMPQEQLMQTYSSADAFLFPSHEGAGMVVPEALSRGLPVICLDNGGPGELVGKTAGFRVPYGQYDGTVKAFSDALEVLYGDAGLRKRMSIAARKHFEQNLSWTVKGDALQKIYTSILSK